MNRIVASAQISLMDYNDAIVTGNMPANPEKDMLWLNTSVNPHIMKQYTGSEWIIVGELDPEYTEKLEVITGNITNLELTLGNMADDGKLDYGDRQEIVDKLLPIIGYLPVNTSVSLKTVSQLDADKKGSFYQLRQSAQNAGIVTSSTAYTGLASAWNALRTYLGGLDPKPWDLSTVNQDAVVQVDKGTFRTHWLNYYNAEYTLATATTQILHSAISTINTTTLPAMRDSALSSGEKAAIKQSLIILSSEKTAMDGEILGLKANPKLENQTPLNEAKSAYDTSYTGVTTAINAVLAVPTGTLIPSTLILEVENAVSSYSAKLSLLKKAMQDSQTAIAKKVSDDASKELSDSLKGYVDKITYGQDIEEIQNQVDGAIMTWFGDNEPTLLTAPAKEWNTTALKDIHLGDLYYDNISGYGYRFGKDGTLYRWIRIVDADVVAALAAAQNAQDTADGKRRAFYNQPTPPYDIGDLWVQGANGELMRAVVTKPPGGIYHTSDWVKATKYTDDTALENLEIGGTNLLRNSNFATGDLTGWLNNGNATYALVDNKKCAYINTSSNGIYQSNVSKDEDAFYSVSFLAKALDSTTSGRFGFLNATGQTWKTFTFTTEWRKYTFTTGERVPPGQIFHIYGQGKRFYITNVQVERGMKATDWSASPEDISAEISSAQIAAQNYATNHITQNIQPQIDGKIESFSQTTDPSVAWTTTLDKTNHEGDLWYHPTSKETKRWNGTTWIKLEDKAALDAANLAATKMQVFIAQPKGPYYVGDLWVQGTTGDLMRCQTQNLTVNGYNASHWVKATKYTDDTTATAAATAASNAQIAANKAQEDATKANGAVSDIISDNKMTPDEKVILQREWLNIQYERNEILPQSERYSVENSSYRSVYDTLNGYLAPFFTNLTTTQDVNGETLRSNFQRYYEQRQAILDAISVAAQQKVLDLQTQVDAGPFADKTDVLSGAEIFTDKADEGAVVHVEVDGKSVQGDDSNLFDIAGWLSTPNGEKPASSGVPYISIQLEPRTNYTVSTNIPNRGSLYDVFAMRGGGTASSTSNGVSVNNSQTVLTNNDGMLQVAMRDYSLNRESGYWIKVEKGEMATTFNGYATQTPGYPIEIHSLNDFNVISTQSKSNLDDTLDFYRNTDLIVTDPTKKIYADSLVPNPPVGAVFNNLNIQSNLIARTNIDFPAVHNTVMVLIKLYQKTNDAQYLNRALLIGDYVLSRGFEASFYGSMMYLIPNRVSLVGGQWKNVTGEINLRTLYQALNVTTSLYRITNDTKYSIVATKLMKTIGNAHNNVNVRVTRDSELEQYMFGASYDLIYVNEQNNMTYGWMNFNQSNADMLVESIKHYVTVFGNSAINDWEGTSFTPQSIIDNFGSHIKAIHANGMLTMSGTGLPYNFFDYGTGGVNWDWVDNTGRGNKWFAGDAILWIIKGIADLGKTDAQLRAIASTYRNNFYNLMVKTHSSYPNINQRALFYDRYNFDGTHLANDDSLSTSSTALLWMIDEDLGISDSSLHSKMFSTLVFHMYKNSENSNFDGSYGWDAATADALVEVKATGEIYLSKFFETFTKEYPNPHTSNKSKILLSEPLRSVGDVKDRLYRDSDGLWKVERNVGQEVLNGNTNLQTTGASSYEAPLSTNRWVIPSRLMSGSADTNFELCSHLPHVNYVWSLGHFPEGTSVNASNQFHLRFLNSTAGIASSDNQTTRSQKIKSYFAEQLTKGTPVTIQYQLKTPYNETLPQVDQDKLNSITSYKNSNYLYTIVDKPNVLPEYVRDNLKPNLRATFKSQAWYQNYKRGDDLRHFVEIKGLNRAIRFGMLVDYQSFTTPTSNWLYFCKIQTNTDDFREELVDEDGSIFDYTTQREIKVPKQALDLRGVTEGTTGYLAFDTRNQLMWFIHYKRNYTYTTNQETGIIEKIPSSEHWIKWNPGKTGHNTQLVLDESVYIVGEIER